MEVTQYQVKPQANHLSFKEWQFPHLENDLYNVTLVPYVNNVTKFTTLHNVIRIR